MGAEFEGGHGKGYRPAAERVLSNLDAKIQLLKSYRDSLCTAADRFEKTPWPGPASRRG
jgi:hypothetical protein